MAKLLDATGQAIFSGIHPSPPDSQVPLWKDGRNVVFDDASVRPGRGQFLLFVKLSGDRITGLIETRIGTTKTVFWGTPIGLFKGVEGSSATTDLTRASGAYTGTIDDPWVFSEYGNIIFATNGVDEVQISVLGAQFEDMSTAAAGNAWDLPDTFRCKLVRTLGPFLLCLNTDNSDQEIIWSDEDDFTTFAPAPDNLAGDMILRDLDSPIQATNDFADGIAVYGVNQMHLVRFIGAPFVFQQQHLLSGVGVLGPHALAPVGRQHYGLGPQGIFLTDGGTFQYVGNPSVHSFIFEDRLDFKKLNQAVVWQDPEEDTAFFSFPTLDGEGITLSFNYSVGAWSIHEFWRTAASSAAVFDAPIVGTKSGDILSQGIQQLGVVQDPSPLEITAKASLQLGYEMGGYGELGYGGIRTDLDG